MTKYKPVSSSIIAEGLSTWNGTDDLGNGAIITPMERPCYALERVSADKARQLLATDRMESGVL